MVKYGGKIQYDKSQIGCNTLSSFKAVNKQEWESNLSTKSYNKKVFE